MNCCEVTQPRPGLSLPRIPVPSARIRPRCVGGNEDNLKGQRRGAGVTIPAMKATAATLLALAGLSIATLRAAEPTETLTLACRGERIWWGAPNTDPVKEQVSMGIIVNFTARTVNGLGSDWRDAIPIHTITDTAITFFAERQNDSVEGSIIVTIDRITGDVDAGINTSGSSGKVSILYSLKCEPSAWL